MFEVSEEFRKRVGEHFEKISSNINKIPDREDIDRLSFEAAKQLDLDTYNLLMDRGVLRTISQFKWKADEAAVLVPKIMSGDFSNIVYFAMTVNDVENLWLQFKWNLRDVVDLLEQKGKPISDVIKRLEEIHDVMIEIERRLKHIAYYVEMYISRKCSCRCD